MIELITDSDIRFLYRLRLNHLEYEKLRRENKISKDDEGILKFIKDFIRGLSKNRSTWLESSLTAEKCLLTMMRESDLGSRADLVLPLLAVKGEEFTEYLIAHTEKYKKAWKKAESDANGYQRRVAVLQKETEKLKDVAKEKDELQRKYDHLKNMNDTLESKLDVSCWVEI